MGGALISRAVQLCEAVGDLLSKHKWKENKRQAMDSYLYQSNHWFSFSPAVLLLGLVWTAAVYFLPAFIAFRRRHRNRIAILVINLLLGFSGVGWIVAAAWALTGEIGPEYPVKETTRDEPKTRVSPTFDNEA